MRAFAIGLLAAAASADMGPAQWTALVDGVLIGALETESVDGLATCIKDFNPLVTSMTRAVHDFEDGSYHKIADGIYALGLFVSEVGVIMEDCPSACDAEDVAQLKAMGDAFLHPKELIINAEHHVVVNGVEIWRGIHGAKKQMHQGNYEAAGEKWGKVFATVLWGEQTMALLQ